MEDLGPVGDRGRPWHLVSLLLRTLLFAVVVPGSVFVLGPILVLRSSDARWSAASDASRVVGIALIVLGAAVMVVCALDFVVRGSGTAAPYDPPRRLVSGRLYAHVRNPMYLGGVAILLGEGVAFRSPALLLYTAVAWALWHLAVVFVEEPGLRRRFGADYEAYVLDVPRWLPRRRPTTRYVGGGIEGE